MSPLTNPGRFIVIREVHRFQDREPVLLKSLYIRAKRKPVESRPHKLLVESHANRKI